MQGFQTFLNNEEYYILIEMGYKVPLFVDSRDLPKVEECLLKAGFQHIIILQEQKENQVFGMARFATYIDWLSQGYGPTKAREMTQCQVHVRGFSDGKIEAELELDRQDIRHPFSPRVSHHLIIECILYLNGIHYRKGTPKGPLDPVKELEKFPKEERVEWIPIVFQLLEAIFIDDQK